MEKIKKMKKLRKIKSILVTILINCLVSRAMAVPVPDNSLNTITTTQENLTTITGGTTAGTNLFHSFEQFSVPTGTEAVFDNAPEIENIFSRITGSDISFIDGIISTNISANLWMLNPNGIIFGPNAQLNIGGTFYGTTGARIHFTDGTSFTTNTSEVPLLTITAPIGLSGATQPIQFVGPGHGIVITNPVFQPVQPQVDRTGVRINLIAPHFFFDGGLLSAGDLNLIANTKYSIDSSAESSQTTIGSILLENQSLIMSNGELRIEGNVSAASASLILGVDASVLVNGNVTMAGIREDLGTRIAINAYSRENSLNINGRVILERSGGIITNNYGVQSRADININGDIYLSGLSDEGIRAVSNLSALAFEGPSGNIHITADQVNVVDGAILTSVSFGSGNSGIIEINADSVQVSGVSPLRLTNSLINTSSFSSGDAGQVSIIANSVNVLNSGQIDSGTFGSGNAGDISIFANHLSIGGQESGFPPAQISSATADIFASSITSFLNLSVPTGNAGNIFLQTHSLNLDLGQITVRSDGIGDTGNILINTQTLQSNRGIISASTLEGDGGNIHLSGINLNFLNQSNISASAAGNGGNIFIDSQLLTGLENSNITANSEQSFGGIISINSQAILGFKLRSIPSPQNDIIASSELGPQFAGKIILNEFSGLTQPIFPSLETYQPLQFNLGCSVAILRFLNPHHRSPLAPLTPQLDEAVGWSLNANGQVVLLGEQHFTPLCNLAISIQSLI
ncbi:filamentous hemagglutinin N-terminal domain-containing protein [Laspinema olomoucense]|uniref:two-partner secretion domain-containing protein n=1 Tax=Laspinema olomoucense TaxID=3231600 RepID=UPI0021BA6400|nr:filamentous hemagglutinin N-terminal domain-containing protein [Laspinema sp. D3c]MCT7992531.1 filamentous hemagglutinin N-terminal domain-containing protein [Laspinema sp. D3c]